MYLPEHDTRNIYIGGFSDRIFDIIPLLEQGNSIPKIIKNMIKL